MTASGEQLLGDLGAVLDVVDPAPAAALDAARGALAGRQDPVIAAIQVAIDRLRGQQTLAYAWRQQVAVLLEQAMRRELDYRAARQHDGPPDRPEPGEEIYLAHTVAEALVPQTALRGPRAAL
jgi:hypothetical protein